MRAMLASEKIRGTQGFVRMSLATSLDSTEINSVAIHDECLIKLNSLCWDYNGVVIETLDPPA